MKFKSLSLVVCLGAVPSAIAADLTTDGTSDFTRYQKSPEHLKRAITRAINDIEQTTRENWSFRITRYENEEGNITNRIEHYDPVLKEDRQWSLLSLNGEQPDEKAQQEFIKAKQEQLQEESEHSYTIKLSEIIRTDSLSFHTEDTENIKAKFLVNLSQLGEESTEKLIGTLSYNKQKAFIENVEIINTEEFSPMFSAKITDFNLTLSFFKIDNAILPHQQSLNMKGSFAFFTDINEESLDTFSEYQNKKN